MTTDTRKTPLRSGLLRQTIVALLVSAAMLAAAAISCTEVVVVTVEVEVTREVPVTREIVVTRQVFATFEVPVTRIAEVTRQVEVTREVAVTRLVEVTAQAMPISEDTPPEVKACIGVRDLFAELVETLDFTTGEPAMSEDEIAIKWLPIIADVYDSGNEELIQAVDTLIATPLDAPDSTFEDLTFEIVSVCTDIIEW